MTLFCNSLLNRSSEKSHSYALKQINDEAVRNALQTAVNATFISSIIFISSLLHAFHPLHSFTRSEGQMRSCGCAPCDRDWHTYFPHTRLPGRD